MDIQKILRGHLQAVDNTALYFSNGSKIISTDKFGKVNYTFRLPHGILVSLAANVRILARLLRMSVHHVIPKNDNLVIFAWNKIFVYSPQQNKIVEEPKCIVGKRPLVICDSPYGLFYGEYRGNSERSPIHIMHSDHGVEWKSVCTLNDIRHVHGIFYDEYTDSFWVTTGDTNSESQILRTDHTFTKFEKVLAGSQRTRVINLVFTESNVYFGTDAPSEINFIYKYDRKQKTTHAISKVSGTVFHATKLLDHIYFSTAVEPSKVNDIGISRVYSLDCNDCLTEILNIRKDIFSMKYFQYGQIFFPRGNCKENNLYLSGFATKFDQKTLLMERND